MPFEPMISQGSCCKVLRCEARIPEDVTANTGTQSVTWLRNESVVVNDGLRELTKSITYQSSQDETIIRSDLRLTPFLESRDAGVYQCLFFDYDSDGEVLTTIPFRLDSGKCPLAILCRPVYVGTPFLVFIKDS